MVPPPPFEPRVVLSMSLATQPGVYALLLGSGISTGVGVPTGWGVVEQLVRRVAAADDDPIEGDHWEQWWAAKYPSTPLGYSTLLEALGPTPATRTALLKEFFEASESERADGVKVPGAAHHAIAALVAAGLIRVIVTTNFDRLLEHALDATGVSYQVIGSDQAIAGMEPLAHACATVIKLHGDYTSLQQRNTVEELTSYPTDTGDLLKRILSEYGLIIAGWSGDWDHALLTAIEQRPNRRYPLVWTARSSAGATARRLTASSGDVLIEDATAEEFFPDLLHRVQAIQSLAESPPSLQIKLARLRKALPDPVRHLEVRELFETELAQLRDWAQRRPHAPDAGTNATDARAELDAIRTRFDSLTRLYATGIALDRDRQHTDLWVWVLQQALEARPAVVTGPVASWWDDLAHLPAYLLLRTGILAALAATHEDVAARLCLDPRWSSLLVQGGEELPAHAALHMHAVLDHQVWKGILRELGQNYIWPTSHLTRELLAPIAQDLFGDQGAELALSRMEYRLAIAGQLLRPGPGVHYRSAGGGEFLLLERYRRNEEIAVATDFRSNGDPAAWLSRADPPAPDFDAAIAPVNERLRGLLNEAD